MFLGDEPRIFGCIAGLSRARDKRCDGKYLELDREKKPTLNTNMNVILDLFGITGVVVGFGEGVCDEGNTHRSVRCQKAKHVIVRE